MSFATPTRRPSHATSSIPDVASPPPSFSRRVSAVSSVGGGGGSPSVAGSERKRRTRLRDYYGLATPKEGQALDVDSPDRFDPDSYFHSLSSTASLPDLLKREIDLLNEIRELDGERQSLVYNHHHELIDASDTIRKMKSRAEALDTSLDALKTSFQSISQLSASLAPPPSSTTSTSTTAAPRSPASPPLTPARPRLDPLPESPASPASRDGPDSTPTRRVRSASSATTVAATAPVKPVEPFSPLTHLSALLSLPTLLRALLAPSSATAAAGGEAPVSGRARADALWGTWEPALRSWEDAGVEGAREVGMECREVLRAGGDAAGRRFSVSAVSQRG
ncbi:uncharacterized protein RHOBADRAFT_50667 [Rhodotorula graminis WP1]|uniref:Vacuolar protein sorting-associated protein 51 homolog n=1 Tax=Rhodotorula graminis (strain WP1) TaxID=578459 RepID=A0A194SBQ4_RHOGW|nr:uncharacterized protein RHOBADRAFT_50667 [Rhodotorula graminis WP1]KPV78163.1 hypothetical protein RHOBADRAFT_50667 [Rhodotorula graminis WP1]